MLNYRSDCVCDMLILQSEEQWGCWKWDGLSNILFDLWSYLWCLLSGKDISWITANQWKEGEYKRHAHAHNIIMLALFAHQSHKNFCLGNIIFILAYNLRQDLYYFKQSTVNRLFGAFIHPLGQFIIYLFFARANENVLIIHSIIHGTWTQPAVKPSVSKSNIILLASQRWTSIPVAFVLLCLGAWSRALYEYANDSVLTNLLNDSLHGEVSVKICWSLQWAPELIRRQEGTTAGNTMDIVDR